MFGLPDQRGYQVALEGRLAQHGLAPVSADDDKALGAAHRLSRRASTKVATSVSSTIAKGLSLTDFEAGRATQLKAFAISLGVAPTEIDDAIGLSAKAAFTNWVDGVVASGECAPPRWKEMREVGARLELPGGEQDQIYIARALPTVRAIWERAVVDDLLSPDAEAEARNATAKLNLTPELSGELATKVEHARTRWAIANGPLPVVEVPLSLQRGEVAHTAVSATAYQTSTRTKSISYGGPALRVRIAKGLYYRSGHYQVHRSTEDYTKPIGHGSLVVTSKRLLFISAKGTTSARLDSILHIEPFKDALAVIRSAGKPTTYRFDKADEWLCAILARAIHDATAP